MAIALRKHEIFKSVVEDLTSGPGQIWVQGLWGSARAHFIAALLREIQTPAVIIEHGQEETELLCQELQTFLPDIEIRLLPAWEIPLLENGTPHFDVLAGKMQTLDAFLHPKTSSIAVVSIQALLQKVIPPQSLRRATLKIVKGEPAGIGETVRHLNEHGYERADEVLQPGEFSQRGGILDVFPIQADSPLRVEFDEDAIASIREFSPETQRSVKKTDRAYIFPVAQPSKRSLSSFLSYLPGGTAVFMDEPILIKKKAEEVLSILRDEPAQLSDYVSYGNIARECKAYSVIYLSLLPQSIPGMHPGHIYRFSTSPTECSSGSFDNLAEKIRGHLRNNLTITFYCNNDGEKNRLVELLSDHGIQPGDNVSFHIGRLQSGFISRDLGLMVLSDEEIFGRYQNRIAPRRRRGIPILRESELETGDYVVHLNHGIGRYLGLRKLETDGKPGEFLTIEYLGGDKLYVAPSHIHLVEKYVGMGDKRPPLYRLGGSSWNSVKRRVKRAIRDMAGELLELYATREMTRGFGFSPDSPWQREFESSFIYEETPDQLRTIEEVKADMELPKPMDRLVCGDSGYGKTEIAVRAAFKAVMSGKQAAVLVPTTILAEQHHTTFCERMADYPINVAVLSRFKTPAEQKETITGLEGGTVDVVIGTHRLLQNDLGFRDLGLVIVDEEQRFGVTQKEKLKQLRKTLDVLTMTATPIPRTLYMSLMGARDISIIISPPANRIPVEAHLIPFSRKLIRNAILREIERDGQVFYVHNRVDSIEAVAQMLEELVPEARVETAHGQMPERVLRKVMADFVSSRIDVLACTTIIESGLDIPNANTIIIERSDAYGLADLYQLRGRVGRYTHRAHAFFVVPERNPVTPGARKRLKAIEELNGHGAGFHLSMKDLEIRGAGNLLGPQQHGHVAAIGFDLYCKLLRETVGELKGKKTEEFETTLDLGIEPIIPHSLISDSRNRVTIYRKMAETVDSKGVDELKDELADRFGVLPKSAARILKWLRLKVKARESGIAYIGLNGSRLDIRFRDGKSSVYSLPETTGDVELLDVIEALNLEERQEV